MTGNGLPASFLSPLIVKGSPMLHSNVAVRRSKIAIVCLSLASKYRRALTLVVAILACNLAETANSALIGHFRADGSMFISGGGIAGWQNIADTSKNAASSSGNRPVRTTAMINGIEKFVVDFENDLMFVERALPAQGSMMFVMRQDALTGGYLIGGGTASHGISLLPSQQPSPDGGPADVFWVIARNNDNIGDVTSTAHVDPEFGIYTVTWGDAGVNVYKGLGLESPSPGGISSISDPGTNYFNIGGPLENDTDGRFSGQIAEFRIWDTELTAGQRVIAHNEMLNTWFVPEPSSILLGVIGLAGIAVGGVAQRRRSLQRA